MTDELPDRLRLTDEMVERAARAYFHDNYAGSNWDDDAGRRNSSRDVARVVLRAALGGETEMTDELPDHLRLTAEQRETLRAPDARMKSRDFAFDRTGEPAVDAILSAIAWTGNGWRNTKFWNVPGEPVGYDYGPFLADREQSPADVIEAAAREAAAEIADLRERIENAKSALDWFRHPTVVGTLTMDAAEKARWELDGQPEGGDS